MASEGASPVGVSFVGSTARAVNGAVRWALVRSLAVGYGVLYDYIFEHFAAYRMLEQEVLRVIAAGSEGKPNARDVRILDIGCGPGNFSLAMAAAGYSVLGVDAYEPLITLAQEKRRARQVQNVAFKRADLPEDRSFPAGHFDQVVNVHFLYAHPDPDSILREAARVLTPGGHGVFVNLTRRVSVRPTFERLRTEAGWRPALAALLWMVPNAVFESLRPRQTRPHYWNEAEFRSHLGAAGFEVVDMRRTFFEGASLLAWVRKP